MAVSKVAEISAFQVASRRIAVVAASAFFLATVQAQAQQAQIAQDGRVIVTGEGDVAVAPDHAQITTPHRQGWRDSRPCDRGGSHRSWKRRVSGV